MKKLLFTALMLGSFITQAQDFKWHLSDTGTDNGWTYLNIQWDDNCDSAIVALFDKDDNFLDKTTVYLDFGVGKTLITDASVGRRAKVAKIKCSR